MPGRNPKTLEAIEKDNSKTRYTKSEIEKRRKHTPKVGSAVLRVPAWLDDSAKKEWRRIVKLARASNIYTDLDSNALGSYCQVFSRLQEYYLKLNQIRADRPSEWIVDYKGVINSLLRLIRDEENHLRKWGGILGLDPVARARIGIAAPGEDESDPFDDFLNDDKFDF